MVFERFLSPERPADRAIMNYMALEKAGKATSSDLANLGVLIFEKGFPRDAEHYLRQALKLDGDNYEAAYRLGLVLQHQGHDFKAMWYYKKTLRARPGYAQARFMLALAEERCGLRSAAIDDYMRAYRRAPDLANAELNPLVYDSDVQTEVAIRYYQQTVTASTLKVTPIDPASVRQMMQIRAAKAGGQPAQPASQVQPEPQVKTAPQPPAEPTPQTAVPQTAAPPTPKPAASAPGGPRVGSPRRTPTPGP
jgi:tetratricopeptide (TPR) repeat protein